MIEPQAVSIPLEAEAISGLWTAPRAPRFSLVLAHGAGAGMRHRSMARLAEGLAVRGMANLRYNFPYMERGGRRPDPPALAHEAVRAAVQFARDLSGAAPLFAGGRSFGGRMTSQAHGQTPLPGVRGLIFFAFPLHPAGKPGIARADHLRNIATPMLFLQGDRDALAERDLIRAVTAKLPHASLVEAAHADHAFHVPAKSGRTDEAVLSDLLDAVIEWSQRSAEA